MIKIEKIEDGKFTEVKKVIRQMKAEGLLPMEELARIENSLDIMRLLAHRQYVTLEGMAKNPGRAAALLHGILEALERRISDQKLMGFLHRRIGYFMSQSQIRQVHEDLVGIMSDAS